LDTKSKSASEVLTNMLISYPIHFFANYFMLPIYAPDIVAAQNDFLALTIPNLWLGVWFSIISFIRQFVLRRYFEKLSENTNIGGILKKIIKHI